ncbi:hypothetical protein FRC12_006382 [Ceratobasidium sp. 428]|nr:hypothetical protein FRC12_006382 [Ceratobasidium sp. 428]
MRSGGCDRAENAQLGGELANYVDRVGYARAVNVQGGDGGAFEDSPCGERCCSSPVQVDLEVCHVPATVGQSLSAGHGQITGAEKRGGEESRETELEQGLRGTGDGEESGNMG